ncbi:hypothetical protein L6164_003366 [Bauhinia variegata]|uniref:Uncharacterized protein n=1 Tax=Bauhinia variegata TaxID=167791 RepID=A0ACB9Q197_BAUVA|nr:hypothetical protein L6164_003366 [Bauhinia variegata]
MLEGNVPRKGVFKNASALSLIGNSRLCGGISELQLPPCPVKVTKEHHNWKLIIVTTCVVVFLLSLSSVLAIYLVRKRKKSSSTSAVDQASKVSYQCLQHATEGFSANNLIGFGSFGTVYKANLEPEYGVVAVKVLNLQKKGAHTSFIAECNAIRNIRHRNLVKILTCCSSTDYKGEEFKALVFEYMANGSLEKWLHPSIESTNQPRTLSLVQRVNIITNVSSALHYLHNECEQPVIHCDLKPENVLLDHDMVAHVGDFGLARILSTINGISHMQVSSIGIKGTIGYAPPECGMGSDVSTQGDVYSFEILVLEMLTGRRPTEDMFKEGENLHVYVKTAYPDNLVQIVDPAIFHGDLQLIATAAEAEERDRRENPIRMPPNVKECLVSLFRIGLDCSVESQKERMSMANVTRELNVIRSSFPAIGGGKNGG